MAQKFSRQFDPKLTKTLEAQIEETMQKTSFPTDFQKIEKLDLLEEQDIIGSYHPEEPQALPGRMGFDDADKYGR